MSTLCTTCFLEQEVIDSKYIQGNLTFMILLYTTEPKVNFEA